jgi:membrane-associated phospholipid phosphatase
VKKYREILGQIIGVVGTIVAIIVFVRNPSFPTPDKIVLFMIFVFMIFKQALAMLMRFGPFVLVLLAYESFRSVADQLNTHVDYTLAPHIDKLLFGNLPTVYLQNWLWHGAVRWYDVALYLPYMLHFILPIALGILVWKKREKYYWQVVSTYCLTAFMAFITYLIFPAAPPWMASQQQYITPITRISSDVWGHLGLKNFPSFYNEITPNTVAAVPSLHAAWAAIFSIFIFKLFGRRWGALSLTYPLVIVFGTIYEGEHYAFDAIAGIIYAAVAYLAIPYLMRQARKLYLSLSRRVKVLIHQVQ